MRVAIDSGPLTSKHSVRGIGVMVKEQIEAIKNRKDKDLKLELFDFSSDRGKDRLGKEEFDIVHYTSFFPYALTLPDKKTKAKVVVTIQDLIHLVYPEHYPPGLWGWFNYLNQKFRTRFIDRVITISETSKKDIVRFLGIQPEKINVIYLAPSNIYKINKNKSRLEKISDKYGLPEKFVFNLGDVNYNKNIPNLIRACEIAKIPLVIGGKQAKEINDTGLLSLMDLSGPKDWIRFLFDIPHPERVHYAEMLEKFNDSRKVKLLGYIPDSDVSDVFNLATVYCQPSFYEGFGLSVVHAFASGIPVVISRTNTLVEIAGDAALAADPNDPEDLAQKISQVIRSKSLKKDLVEKGFRRLNDFSWNKTAKEIVNVYKSLAGK